MSERSAAIGTVFFGISWLLLSFAFWVTGTVFVLWLGGSVLTSVIKATTNSCDTIYPVETLVNGDWFCPGDY